MASLTEQTLPVWAKQLPGGQEQEQGALFLYYDTFYQYSLSSAGEHPGWAIGRSVGSVCTDDHGYCSFGYTPASCCTHTTGCSRYLVKQTAATYDCTNSAGCPGAGCQVDRDGGCPDDRAAPGELSAATSWKAMHLATSRLVRDISDCGGCHGDKRYSAVD